MSRTNNDKKESKALLRNVNFMIDRVQDMHKTTNPSPIISRAMTAATNAEDTPKGIEMPDLAFYAKRKLEAREKSNKQRPQISRGGRPEAPAPPPANNWIPIGPAGLRKGQSEVQPTVSGRTPGIKVNAAGTRVYIGTANGGVWRSEDTGSTWDSLMDSFDTNPTNGFASDSLACGDIAVNFTALPNTDTIFVGTGEAHFGIGSFFSIGPVASFDGGATWAVEDLSPGSSSLAGVGFWKLALDPNDSTRVVAATRRGIYRRESNGSGGFHWDQKSIIGAASNMTSAVVASTGGTSTFYAASNNGRIYQSVDGNTWNQIGSTISGTGTGIRISLGVAEDDPSVIYAFLADGRVYRYDTSDGNWVLITGIPAAVDLVSAQGWYDLAIAVAPGNNNRIYLGGSTVWTGTDWSGSVYGCDITPTSSGGSITSVNAVSTYIGASCHADIHTFAFAQGDASKLWVGCDGGVFYSTNPTGTGNIFTAKNTGLQTLSMNYLSQHPTEDAVLLCGTQDNGGERYTGEEAWLYSSGGDCGYVVINWDDPYQIMSTYVYGIINKSTDGGTRYSYTDSDILSGQPDSARFYAPLTGTPPNTSSASDANTVVFGSDRPWISDNFGGSWSSVPNNNYPADSLPNTIRSLVMVSKDKFYAGLDSNSEVYKYVRTGASWTRTRVDNIGGANTLSLNGPITDIVVDPADSTGDTIYVTLGGWNDYRHVWKFNGTSWTSVSGPSAGHADSLLDVQHNALVVDPSNTTHLYVGTDIGIWKSIDGGSTWDSFSSGLPDTAVMDLRLHPNRLLRASTHGRGVWEYSIDETNVASVELYIRDTQLDLGRRTTVNNLDDPTNMGTTVRHYRGPDIKVDSPDSSGNYQFPLTSDIDFVQFVDQLDDESTNLTASSTNSVTSKVYVQVHNRGVTIANNVRVMCLLANASAGLPNLPANYRNNVQNGIAINNANWTTLGFDILNDVRVGVPQIASFDLPSSALPPPSGLPANRHNCVLALVHHVDDPYTATNTATDPNSLSDRKSAHKNLTVIEYTGPAPMIVPIRLYNSFKHSELIGLKITQTNRAVKGYFTIPSKRLDVNKDLIIDKTDEIKELDNRILGMYKENNSHIKTLQKNGLKLKKSWIRKVNNDTKLVKKENSHIRIKGKESLLFENLSVKKYKDVVGLLTLLPNRNAKIGETTSIDVIQYARDGKTVMGGNTILMRRVKEQKEGLSLKVKVKKSKDKYIIQVKVYDQNGKDLTSRSEGKLLLSKIHLNGDAKSLGNLKYHRSWRSFYLYIKQADLDGYTMKAEYKVNNKVVATTKF